MQKISLNFRLFDKCLIQLYVKNHEPEVEFRYAERTANTTWG